VSEEKKPVVAKKGSMVIPVEAGEIYNWCSCGKSATQPFCDGSHEGTDFKPVQYIALRDKNVSFCGCKHTKSKPICDGSHKDL